MEKYPVVKWGQIMLTAIKQTITRVEGGSSEFLVADLAPHTEIVVTDGVDLEAFSVPDGNFTKRTGSGIFGCFFTMK